MRRIALFLVITSMLVTGCGETSKNNEAPKLLAEAPVPAADIVQRAAIVSFAEDLLGTPYVYAGSTPASGFDCSGFVNYVFKNFDIEVPRSSKLFAQIGKDVKPEDIKVGDVLVFYGYRDHDAVGHVGIVTEANGMKSKFIHSSSGKEMRVMISDLDSDMYSRRFYKAIDVIGG